LKRSIIIGKRGVKINVVGGFNGDLDKTNYVSSNLVDLNWGKIINYKNEIKI
jgi:hypothetical protein